MSKRDIETVCTLAAHLALKGNDRTVEFPPYGFGAGRCAADAMTLQRLAQNIRARNKALGNINTAREWAEYLEKMQPKVDAVLKPYGLHADYTLGDRLRILGLPGNTLGGEEGGVGI